MLAQEKHQACVDAVNIPANVITVLWKRTDEELENVVLDYFKQLEKSVESSDTHASPSSAPPGTDHPGADECDAAARNEPSVINNQSESFDGTAEAVDSVLGKRNRGGCAVRSPVVPVE